MGICCEVLVDAFQCYGIVVEVEAELSCHGCEFAGFVAEYGHELLCGHGFDASVASFEALYGEVEFRFGFFEVGYGFFDGSGFGELVDESFAFDAAFVLADDDAGFGWIVDGLLAVATMVSPSLSSAFCRLDTMTIDRSESSDGLTASSKA